MKNYKKHYTISAPPSDVYIALTNPDTIFLWTGEPAEMSEVPGSEFSMWDGSIVGKNIEFEKNRKIVQEWYFGDNDVKSIVCITLHLHKKGTSAELLHENIPDEDFSDICEGWDNNYFGELRKFYE
jgi:activator of HSP90 ATPase